MAKEKAGETNVEVTGERLTNSIIWSKFKDVV